MTAVHLRDRSGDVAPAPFERWFGNTTAEEEALLEHVVGPALDVGCGPGRHTLALARRGVMTLGIDVCQIVLGVARERRAPVLHRSVFDRVPGIGRWMTALLLDGNLGLGGDPVALLTRLGTVLHTAGRVLVEADAYSAPPTTVRFESQIANGPWFELAHVGVSDLSRVATGAGWNVTTTWRGNGRWFARLERA